VGVRKLLIAFLLLSLLAGTAVVAADLQVGDVLPGLSLPDQHGEVMDLGPGTQQVLFAADKVASDLLNDFLQQQPDDFLDRHGAVYVADISSMPAIITRLFALPKMRERPYRIMLAESAEVVSFLPRQPHAVTAIRLRNERVASIDYLSTGAELADSL